MPFSLHNLPGSGPRPGPRETIALLAGLMALNAFAIDAMIPALPAISESLNVPNENDRQLVVIAYMIGFGSTQLVWGPLADRFGRKPILAAGVGLYAFFAILPIASGASRSLPRAWASMRSSRSSAELRAASPCSSRAGSRWGRRRQ